jgi:hypothetical protein
LGLAFHRFVPWCGAPLPDARRNTVKRLLISLLTLVALLLAGCGASSDPQGTCVLVPQIRAYTGTIGGGGMMCSRGPCRAQEAPEGMQYAIHYAARTRGSYDPDRYEYTAILSDGSELSPYGVRLEKVFSTGDEEIGTFGPKGDAFTVFPSVISTSRGEDSDALSLVFIVPASEERIRILHENTGNQAVCDFSATAEGAGQ